MFISSWIINGFLVAAAIVLHYETLSGLSLAIPKLRGDKRYRILIVVFGSMAAHLIEIWLFAIGYWFYLSEETFGELRGNFDGSFIDCVYFSFINYTTLGYGDIEPHGDIRFLTGLEALTGLVLITWTASFVFIEMRKYWGMPDDD